MDFSSFSNAGSGYLPPKVKTPSTPPELASLTVYKSRICELHIPYNTSRSKSIREFTGTWVVNTNGTRMFVFRKMNDGTGKWTTVALDSTPDAPKLTAQPEDVIAVCLQHMPKCPDIASFRVRDWTGRDITVHDVPHLPFDALPGQPAMNPTVAMTSPMTSVASMTGGAPHAELPTLTTQSPYNAPNFNPGACASAPQPQALQPPQWSYGYNLSVPAPAPGPSTSATTDGSPMWPPVNGDGPTNDTFASVSFGTVQTQLDALSVNFSRDLIQLETKIDAKFNEALADHTAKVMKAITAAKNELVDKITFNTPIM